MAKEDEKPTSVDKGKGKAVEEKPKEPKRDKDGKIIKEDEKLDLPPVSEELSEEDQQLKSELDMLVERIQESDTSLYKPALEAIKNFIKTSTSSMTAVPKPLKFLRPHYEQLEKTYESWPEGEDKVSFADMMSVLGMTYSDEDRHDCLKYRLLSPSKDLGSWGHEYMRHLALEIGQEFQNRLNDDKPADDLTDLALTLVPFFLKHNAEADVVDILSELEMIEQIVEYLDENTFSRVALYMVSMVPLLTYPDNDRFLRTAYKIYSQYKQYTPAVVIAIRLNDKDLIQEAFDATEDKSIKKQMAFLIARQRVVIDLPEDEEDGELAECLSNTRLADYFKHLGKELNVLDPKTPDDIYKTHLESSRTAGLTNTDSARHNLASAFVNAFVNAGFGQDKMMLVDEDKNSWVWRTKDEGMLSTAASLGLLMQWDTEGGLDKIDRYTYLEEDQIKAGAMLASGIVNSGVRSDADPAMALLGDTDNLENKSVQIRVASIMGLGLAYAGSNKEELLDLLLPIVGDTSLDMQLSAMAALALGMIFVGSAQSDVSEAIIQTFLDEDRTKQLKDKWTRFMALGLALLFFGQQEEVDVILETLKAIDHPMSKPTSVLAEVCAWAGTGAVLKIQQLLHICNEHFEEENEDKKGDELLQAYAVIGISLVAMGEEVGQEMVLRNFGHLMHYGEANIRKAVPLAMGLISPSNPQMKVYDTLSRYSHDNDNDVAINAIFAMGLLGAGTNNARLAQLLRQLASYYSRDPNALFMVRIAQGLLHMGKGTVSVNPFHTDRQVLSRVAAAGLLTVLVSLIDAKQFVLADSHYLLYFMVAAMQPRFLITLDEELKPVTVNVRVGQAVDVVGQAGRPKTITGWQTQSTPVLLAYGERAELEDEQYISLASTLEGIVILRKNPEWEEDQK
ncbi:uncharacterized protein K452DRAFT_224638 [Aplosporella prunicola CBS 121167]|uniref:26S proteasome regulatory subunit RPN1 n=1 Tax=Aplosporella prunicola CBS 121167 TaxID=1176127 RepID=A0A6A6BI69_9PEZI|nr:uncharacterized protein K452DRAFT_224638 [Aplosporella prunicola CBS 121167]KAF2143830.1 hypothetical protein K452DRAFT_224638 [Aplosporella prunicola CBS 121167]